MIRLLRKDLFRSLVLALLAALISNIFFDLYVAAFAFTFVLGFSMFQGATSVSVPVYMPRWILMDSFQGTYLNGMQLYTYGMLGIFLEVLGLISGISFFMPKDNLWYWVLMSALLFLHTVVVVLNYVAMKSFVESHRESA